MNKLLSNITAILLVSGIGSIYALSDSNSVILSCKECKWAIGQRTHNLLKNNKIDIFKINDTICQTIENNLPKYIDSMYSLNKTYKGLIYYKRQYIGFIYNKKKYVYINLFPNNDNFNYWKKTPVLVKDGGTSFCGVIYDLESNQFIEIACNGNA